MQMVADLAARFAIQDHLSFHESVVDSNTGGHGLVEMRIVSAYSEATLFLYGAHLTRWVPRGGQPVFYTSPQSEYAPGKAIRGGVPVLFPWFGPRWDGGPAGVSSPSHGFARTAEWTLERTHLAPDGEVHVELSLAPTDLSRSLGYDDFHVAYSLRIGASLHMELLVQNRGGKPLVFEEGLHAYFAVSDIEQIRIDGLRGSTYVDKRDHDVRKVQRETQLAITRDVDQVHVCTAEPLLLHDRMWGRALHVRKEGSEATVVWNPWSTLTPGLKDLPENGWRHFVCIETVNVGENRITLPPGGEHRMGCTVSSETDASGVTTSPLPVSPGQTL